MSDMPFRSTASSTCNSDHYSRRRVNLVRVMGHVVTDLDGHRTGFIAMPEAGRGQ